MTTLQDKIDKAKEMHEKIEGFNLLEAQAQALSDQNDFLEECIVEMAMIIYAE